MAAVPLEGARLGSIRRRWTMALLVAVGTCSSIDRLAVGIMGPAMARDLGLTDFQLGLMSGFGFALVYLFLGLPLARLADRGNRVRLIAACVAIWSGCLILCGQVRSFTQLLLSRSVISVGEAGVQPASVAMVSDLYPRERRGTALGVMALGVPLGTVIGSVAGGYLADMYGWRAAMVILGIPGMALAALFLLTVREPPREGRGAGGADAPPLRSVVRLLLSKPTFWHIIIAVAVINIAIFGIGVFLPVYFTRVIGLSLTQTGALNGIVGAVSTIGYFVGGMVVDRLRRRDERWQAWLAALGVAIGAPFYFMTFQLVDPVLATGLLTIGGIAMFVYYTPVQLILQNMVEARMRATAAFMFFLVSGLVGSAFGPSLVGLVSDVAASRAFGAGDFAAACGQGGISSSGQGRGECAAAAAHGLRVALTLASLLFLWAALHLSLASRTLRRDLVAPDAAPTAAVASLASGDGYGR